MRAVLMVLTGLWAAAMAASLWGLLLLEPTGDGFVRGLNRVAAFFGFQFGAAMVAAALWIAGRRLPAGSAGRRLSRVPALLALGLVVVLVAAIAAARLGKPDPQMEPPPGIPTAPPK